MTAHPGFEALVDLAEGRAPAARGPADHAAACARCGGALEWLRGALGLLGDGAAAEPPRAVLRRAVRIHAAARVRGAVDAVRTLVARLVFDSAAAAPAPAPAFRGAAPRRLLFRAGPWDLDLVIAGETVRGSLLPRDEGAAPPPARGEVRLLRGKRAAATARLDARGRFALGPVRPGRYVLEVRAGGDAVRVPEFIVP